MIQYGTDLEIDILIKGTEQGAQKTHTHLVYDSSHCILGLFSIRDAETIGYPYSKKQNLVYTLCHV